MISRDKLNGLGESNRAVSPVVGVALLIAITVILAAVIGFVVLDTTDAENAASTDARMDFTEIGGDATTNGVTIAHEGGDKISENNLAVKVNGVEAADAGLSVSWSTDSDGDFETGESVDVGTAGGLSGGDTIVVVFEDPNSDRENQLGTYEVPV